MNDFDKTEKLLKGWFTFVAVIAVAIIGVSIWATITIVNWLTSLG